MEEGRRKEYHTKQGETLKGTSTRIEYSNFEDDIKDSSQVRSEEKIKKEKIKSIKEIMEI